jgi:hypothetical protein
MRLPWQEFCLSLRKNSRDSVISLNEPDVQLPFRDVEAKYRAICGRHFLPVFRRN